MSTRALLFAAFIVLATQGCSITGLGGGGPPPPGQAKRLDCDNSARPHKCRVEIEPCALGCAFRVNFDEIHLARSSAASPNTDIDIVWHLPRDYVFCNKASSDGGVILKGTNDGQFSDMYSTDDPDGGRPADPDCKKHRHFRWTAKNTVPRPNYPYEYAIIFYDKGAATSTRHIVDPWIYND